MHPTAIGDSRSAAGDALSLDGQISAPIDITIFQTTPRGIPSWEIWEMRDLRAIIGACAIALAFAPPLQADDPCDGLEAKVKHFLLTPGGLTGELWSDGEAATVRRFRHNAGDGILVKWNFGAGGRVECGFIAYRTAGEQYQMFRVPTRHIDVQDIDRDGVDELVLLDGLSWGMDCSSAMATIPFGLRIAHLKASSGALIDVTRNYGGYVAVFVENLKGHFDDYVAAEGGKVTTACEDAWVALLKLDLIRFSGQVSYVGLRSFSSSNTVQ